MPCEVSFTAWSQIYPNKEIPKGLRTLRKLVIPSTVYLRYWGLTTSSRTTLDVTFAQHPDPSCIPALLQAEVGLDPQADAPL